MRSLRFRQVACAAFLMTAWSPAGAQACSHLWRFRELFSNADGTIQFIEMQECCGGVAEVQIAGFDINSEVTGMEFIFPDDLTPPTDNKYLMFGTVGFAALPGAPTPDYIIPDGFFNPNGDTLRYAFYKNATLPFLPGTVPTNGIDSVTFEFGTLVTTVGVNSPTNFAGETGAVALVCVDGDNDGYGFPGSAECPSGSATDCDDNNSNINPGATEICGDNADNDCNGLADCDDPACVDAGCIPAASGWGLLILGIGLLATGTVVFSRTRRASTA
jgi:Putative metal-binding motif